MSVLRLRQESLEWRHVEGETVVLDLNRAEYLQLNPTGTRLWDRLADGATAGELAAELTGKYGIDQRQAEADVGAFLSVLRARQLLEP